jgi:hypothetical protein
MLKSLSQFLTIFFSVIILAGCQGLSDNLIDEFERMSGKQERLERLIEQRKTDLDNLTEHPDAEFLLHYAESEKWSQNFDHAKQKLDEVSVLYLEKIKPLYEKDDPLDTNKVIKLNREFTDKIISATKTANFVKNRVLFLLDSRESSPAIYEKSQQHVIKIKDAQKEISEKIDKAILDYPNKKEDLESRKKMINALVERSSASDLQLNTEFNKVRSNSQAFINYATIGDKGIAIEKTLVEMEKQKNEAARKISQLEKSYVKVLADQRIDYYLVVRRASWCNGEYCGNGTERSYQPTKVDAGVFEYFDSPNISTLATISRSWGSDKFKVKVKSNMWKALSINERYRWKRGHTDAEFWIQKMYTKTFHKYIEIENDQPKETGWQSVSESYFNQQYDNLGMAILTKPYGFYEEDAISHAQPLGMATIAQPIMKNNVPTGSNQYGEWRQSNGQSFWHYYGMYAMFSNLVGGNNYRYNDWQNYNSRTRGSNYYGTNKRWGTFGSSTYKNSRYQNSGFARSNASTVYSARTGKSSSGTSIRGASSSNRNRGPSSRGK